jgi:hypothetical protein
MQGTLFEKTIMQWASLVLSQMQGAKFDLTHMQEAWLYDASMEGAQFSAAELRGATFSGVKIDETTSFTKAALQNTAFRKLDFRATPALLASIADTIPTVFADASVLLPHDHPRPAHWPTWVIDPISFDTEYRKWLASPATYIPHRPLNPS